EADARAEAERLHETECRRRLAALQADLSAAEHDLTAADVAWSALAVGFQPGTTTPERTGAALEAAADGWRRALTRDEAERAASRLPTPTPVCAPRGARCSRRRCGPASSSGCGSACTPTRATCPAAGSRAATS